MRETRVPSNVRTKLPSRRSSANSVLRRIRREHVVLMHLHQMFGQRPLRVERLPTHVTYPGLRVASLFGPLAHMRLFHPRLASAHGSRPRDASVVTHPDGGYTRRWRLAIFDVGTAGSLTKEESRMLAAIGLGLVGTILVIVLVIAAIMFFMRRA